MSGNKTKFLLGTLVGAVLMMMSDLNDMFQELQQQQSPQDTFTTPNVRRNEMETEPEVRVNRYLEKMNNDPRLYRSAIQLSSFLRKKDALSKVFYRQERFDVDPGEYAATTVSELWAYLHVWANGGDRTVIRVVEDQLNEFQQRKDVSEIRNRRWMALVRDPIQHFLEGWAIAEIKVIKEIMAKGHDDLASKIKAEWESTGMTYDQRVNDFLERVKKYSRNSATAGISPLMHGLPQSNFLMNDAGTVHSNLLAIGDANEWEAMMEMAGFKGDVRETDLDAESTLRAKYFPTKLKGLSRQTILNLCDFLAIDYYLFRYDAPSSCLKKYGPLDFEHRFQKLQVAVR